MTPIEEARATIARLQQERVDIAANIAAHQMSIEALERRDSILMGWSRDGLIPQAQAKLARLEQTEKDQALPRPVWIHAPKDEYVITRVTPARVYLREVGNSDEQPWQRATGYRYPYGARFDVPATLAAWEARKR
ncbi:MAG: hypothetical protein WC911_02085 [Thermoleophilia bacterium]